MEIEWCDSRLQSHPLLRELVAFAEETAAEVQRDRPDALLDLGLGLTITQPDFRYDATPLNALVFATTAGDGVHYGLLEVPDKPHEQWPVVMTVPMLFEHPNLVVGATLYEFLCLGYFTGWFPLEQLAYSQGFDWTGVPTLERGQPDYKLGGKAKIILQKMREKFRLQPWPDVRRRLAELQREWMPFVRVDTSKL